METTRLEQTSGYILAIKWTVEPLLGHSSVPSLLQLEMEIQYNRVEKEYDKSRGCDTMGVARMHFINRQS